MDDIIINLEALLTQFQTKFLEIEGILHNTNKQFNRLKARAWNKGPIQGS